MFRVYGMCLNLLLLNQRDNSGSALLFYCPSETYLGYYVIKLPAEQRQQKQLCQCKHGSQITVFMRLSQQHTVALKGWCVRSYIFICLMLPEQVRRFIEVLGGLLVRYPTQLDDNGFASHLHQSSGRRLLAAAEGTRVDTADLCYSRRNIWPCLFLEIDPTLCFEFIRKYVSGHPVCSG